MLDPSHPTLTVASKNAAHRARAICAEAARARQASYETRLLEKSQALAPWTPWSIRSFSVHGHQGVTRCRCFAGVTYKVHSWSKVRVLELECSRI